MIRRLLRAVRINRLQARYASPRHEHTYYRLMIAYTSSDSMEQQRRQCSRMYSRHIKRLHWLYQLRRGKPAFGGYPVTLDVGQLLARLDRKRRSQNLSWRDVSAKTKTSPSTFSRLKEGRRPDVDTFGKLVSWLGEPAEEFFSKPEVKKMTLDELKKLCDERGRRDSLERDDAIFLATARDVIPILVEIAQAADALFEADTEDEATADHWNRLSFALDAIDRLNMPVLPSDLHQHNQRIAAIKGPTDQAPPP